MASDKPIIIASVALLVGLAAVGLQVSAAMKAVADHPSEEEEDDSDLADPTSLDNRLQDAEKRLEAAEKRSRELEERLGKAEREAAEASAAAANALRMHGERGAMAAAGGAATPEDAEAAARKARGEEILARIREGRLPDGGVIPFFQEAKDAGVLDEALKEMEAWAKAHADDPDAQVDLAQAYIAKLMAVPDGMERGTWSMKSLAACERALKTDPEHWSAQFVKGMNLSQWPAFLGKQPEAIKTFENLLEQQERSPAQPEFAQTYYQLGNTYRAAGNTEKAREAFRRGLERFPEDKQLKEQLELLEKR